MFWGSFVEILGLEREILCNLGVTFGLKEGSHDCKSCNLVLLIREKQKLDINYPQQNLPLQNDLRKPSFCNPTPLSV